MYEVDHLCKQASSRGGLAKVNKTSKKNIDVYLEF